MFSLSLAASPAVAVVTVGVLGALGARMHRRSSVLRLRASSAPRGAIRMLPQDGRIVPNRSDDGAETAMFDGPDARVAAMQLLDVWSTRPQSAWQELGARTRQLTKFEAGELAASQLILEGVVALQVSAVDAWMVRDAVDTAWFLAPADGGPSSSEVDSAARRAVTNAALAVLAHEFLPAEDRECFLRQACP